MPSYSTTNGANLCLQDIDWEYPGGNGADYKQIPNTDKTYQVEAFPRFLAATRRTIGKDKILSIAVPGKKGRFNHPTQEHELTR